MKFAVIGSGISGLGSAYLLSQRHEVDLYEKLDRLGGHARTTYVETSAGTIGMDTGFLVFNNETYPLLTKLFEKLDVAVENSDMSFGFWDEKSNVAYNGQSLGGLFFQRKNLLNPRHYGMIRDILHFNKKANRDIETAAADLDLSLGDYLRPYGEIFRQRYILPMGAAIWSTPADQMHDFPARTFLQFFKNHGLLGVSTQHQWQTVSDGSINYVNKAAAQISGRVILNSDVTRIRRREQGVALLHADGRESHYDKVVLAMHAPDALALLESPTEREREVLGAFKFKQNDAVLHSDNRLLYPDRGIYAAWNYKRGGRADAVTLSYWINRLQNLKVDRDYFVSLNETSEVGELIERIEYDHPQFDRRAIEAQSQHQLIQNQNHTLYAGAYWRYGFHEDGLLSATRVAGLYDCSL